MSSANYFFTSESVTEGHPDKVADQISDSILDAILREDPKSRVACETLVTTGLVLIAGEITTNCYVEMPGIVRQTIKEIGYNDSSMGFDWETCAVIDQHRQTIPGYRHGGQRRRPERTRGRGPGHDVRLRLQRNQGLSCPCPSGTLIAWPDDWRKSVKRASSPFFVQTERPRSPCNT